MNCLYYNQPFTANNNSEDPLMANYYYFDNSTSPNQQNNTVIKQDLIPVFQYHNYPNVLQDDNFSIASYPIVPDLNVAPATHFNVDQTQQFYQSNLSPQLSECCSSINSVNMCYYPQDPVFMDSLFPSVIDSSSNSSNSSTSKKKQRKTTSLTDKRHICPVCSHRSKRKHNLVEHMLTHNPHRPKSFLCSHCARPFARKYDMKRHEKIHTRSL
ncbi:hypothetical protein PS15m_011601 [Mucor circinelloides]